MLLAAAEAVVLTLLFSGGQTFNDITSYLHSWEILQSGQPDIFRTPVYPIFIGIIGLVVPHSMFAAAVAACQFALFIVSIRPFAAIARRFFPKGRTAVTLTYIYALFPAITSWCACILTESLAVTMSVFMVHHLLRAADTGSVKHSAAASLWMLVSVFLRPAMMYMLPVTAVVWIMVLFQKRRRVIAAAAAGFAGVAVTAAAMLAYCSCIERHYGIFTVSSVGMLNDYCTGRYFKCMDFGDIADTGVREFFEEAVDPDEIPHDANFKDDPVYDTALQRFGYVRMKQAIGDMKRAQGVHWYLNAVKRMFSSHATVFTSYTPGISYVVNGVLGFSFNTLYLLLAAYCAAILLAVRRCRRLPWAECLLLMLCASNIIVIYVGAQAEWGRLFVPSVPWVLIIAAQLLASYNDYIFRRMSRKQTPEGNAESCAEL